MCPSWTEYAAKPGEVVVRLDPGMAFGTGHHPTTRLCLAELERRMRPGARVLDVGTGSGILAIAAAGLGASSVVGLDRDATACTVARRNVRANGPARRVRIVRGSIPRAGVSGFDIVLANISAKVLTELASPLARTLAPDGLLIASGVLEEQSASVAEAFRGAGLRVDEVRAMEDWVVIVATAVVVAGDRCPTLVRRPSHGRGGSPAPGLRPSPERRWGRRGVGAPLVAFGQPQGLPLRDVSRRWWSVVRRAHHERARPHPPRYGGLSLGRGETPAPPLGFGLRRSGRMGCGNDVVRRAHHERGVGSPRAGGVRVGVRATTRVAPTGCIVKGERAR